MKIPYEKARSGMAARDEITRVLSRFGCQSVGFMDDFAEHSVLLAFQHKGRNVQLRASAQGWAALWLKENPYSTRRHCSLQDWKNKALQQGLIAVNSILRDWVKGHITEPVRGTCAPICVYLDTNNVRASDEVEANVAFIAATNPATVLALIKRVEKAEAALRKIADGEPGIRPGAGKYYIDVAIEALQGLDR